MGNLYEELEAVREKYKNEYKELPLYIKNNLNVKEIRDYQDYAFRNYITYFENPNLKQSPSRVLFHMATGSGKTLIMAGLLLYLYKQGYRDFMFFVNTSNIIEKTKANFLLKNSTKYLFKEKITIDNKIVNINEVQSFMDGNSDEINIMFLTTAKLHQDMNMFSENSMDYSDFENRKIVLIADEAHHLNVSTKKGKKTKQEIEEESNWENTVKRLYGLNAQNILLEFTATCNVNDENIKKEYEDKIIFNYDLKRFRNDGFSKEIQIVRTDLDIFNRALIAIIFSQYRLKLFQDNHIQVKPCVLFKSDTKENSEKNRIKFLEMLNNLTGDYIEDLINSVDNENIIKMKRYFESKLISYSMLANELKNDFGDGHIISANDDDELNNKQLLLNSLESLNNPYRAIFEVKKLDEGWDVLNLFDIVRMYETRQSGSKVLSGSTVSEAQLIGRGARYYPFKLNNDDNEYKRKFDDNLDNELRFCETLLYHCQNESRYITEIHQALVEIGAKDKDIIEIEYILKESFKQKDFYKFGQIFYNSRYEVPRSEINSLDSAIRNKIYEFKIDTRTLELQNIIDNEKIEASELEEISFTISDIVKINYYIVKKAIQQYDSLSFSNLKKVFPNLQTMREFITDKNYLSDIKIKVFTKKKYLTIDEYYTVCINLMSNISNYVIGIDKTYKGTLTFNKKNISAVFTNKKKELSSVVKNGEGESQKLSTVHKLDLSKKDWYVYEDNYGTGEEKAFVAYMDTIIPQLQQKYNEIYLIRNERQMHLYSFDEGKRFEPDYLLFLLVNNKKEYEGKPNLGSSGTIINNYDQLQIFIEPKGDQLLDKDKWKEDFLLQLKELNQRKIQVDNITYGDYGVWGLHFYNESRNARTNDFDNDMKELY